MCFRQKNYCASFRAEHQLTRGWPKPSSRHSQNSTHMKIKRTMKRTAMNENNKQLCTLSWCIIYKRSIVRSVSERFWIVCCACSACSSWRGISSWHLRIKIGTSERADWFRQKEREANEVQETLEAHSQHDRTFCGRLKLGPNSVVWSLKWVFDKHLEEEASVAYPSESSSN